MHAASESAFSNVSLPQPKGFAIRPVWNLIPLLGIDAVPFRPYILLNANRSWSFEVASELKDANVVQGMIKIRLVIRTSRPCNHPSRSSPMQWMDEVFDVIASFLSPVNKIQGFIHPITSRSSR
jgi:hypothetical protein